MLLSLNFRQYVHTGAISCVSRALALALPLILFPLLFFFFFLTVCTYTGIVRMSLALPLALTRPI